MITGARLIPDVLLVRFADELAGVIPFGRLELRNQPDHVTVPNAHVVEVHLVDGTVEEVPWDFARHFADPGYRARSESVAQHDRRLFGERLRTLRTRATSRNKSWLNEPVSIA